MTVRDFALCAWKPKELKVAIGGEEYEMVSSYGGNISKRMMDFFGDYVVESFKTNEPDKYAVWVVERPIKAAELETTTP